MNRHKIFVFFLALYLGIFFTTCAKSGNQYEYDWDKVDEKALNERQPPDKVMDALGIEPGMMVGEVGAGGGRYAVLMAERVGPSGKVYANDISLNAVGYLKNRCKKGSKNSKKRMSILCQIFKPTNYTRSLFGYGPFSTSCSFIISRKIPTNSPISFLICHTLFIYSLWKPKCTKPD